MRAAILIALALVAAGAGDARADEPKPGSEQLRPRAPRLFHVPTAYLQPGGGLFVSAGGSHRGGTFGAVALGVGGVAEVGAQLSDDLGECSSCTAEHPVAAALPTRAAWFKIGLAEDRFFRHQPALALGFRAQIGTADAGELDELRGARMYAVASRTLGSVRLHLGLDVWDGGATTAAGKRVLMHEGALGARARPFGGVGWTPDIYPRTTVIAEVSWVPSFRPESIELRWLAAWGVRYQAFDWGSVELAVRHRQRGTLDDSTVLLRANVLLDR
jgi:hypothetical protein